MELGHCRDVYAGKDKQGVSLEVWWHPRVRSSRVRLDMSRMIRRRKGKQLLDCDDRSQEIGNATVPEEEPVQWGGCGR